jgi:sn-glycerol 3-phosphate transport system substrate-binding protein
MNGRRRFLAQAAAGLGALALGCEDRRIPPGRKVAALWFTYGGKNRKTLEALVKAFNVSQSEHFIHAVFQGDYFEGLAKLRTAIAAGAAPGLSHVVGEVVPYLAEAGVLEPLDDYPGAKELDVLDALGQRGSFIDGGDRPLVTLPFNRSTPIAYLNDKLFQQAGVATPRTWEDLRQAARALTRKNPDGSTRFGFACPIDWWFWAALVEQAGGTVVEADGGVSLGGDAGVRALELWKTMVDVDGSMKPPPGRDYNAWEQTNQDFLAGRVAMIWTSTAFLRYLEENAPFDVAAAPLPMDVRRAVPTGGTHWIIPKAAPEQEKPTAWAFLRFMQEPAQVIDWATKTGYLPTTRGAVKRLTASGFYDNHPNDLVAVDQLAFAVPWPWSTELFRVQREIVQPRLEDAVLGRADAKTVLDRGRALAERWRR